MSSTAIKASSAPWKTIIQKSLEQNKSLAYSKYMQVATVQPDGRPANRTVVFRGFLGDSDDITFVTDRRSSKVSQVAVNTAAEICWYFPVSREQYRISGHLKIISADHDNSEMLKARQMAWDAMSDGGRTQFSWPNPGERRVSDAEAFKKAAPGPQEPALETFCLVVLEASEVDYVQLFENNREVFIRNELTKDWHSQIVNP